MIDAWGRGIWRSPPDAADLAQAEAMIQDARTQG
jgi:hypothetical protein